MTSIEALFIKDLKQAVEEFYEIQQPSVRSHYSDSGNLTFGDLEDIFTSDPAWARDFQKFTEERGEGFYAFLGQDTTEQDSISSNYRWIYKHTSADGKVTYAQVSASFDSWNGVDQDFGTVTEVMPVEVTKIEWQYV